MIKKKIRVLVVDDSALMRKMIPQMLAGDDSIDVVGTAMDGTFCLKKIEELQPNVVTLDLVNQRLVPSSMEPRCALASYDAATDRVTLRLSSQMPSGARDTLCEVLGLPTEQIRVAEDLPAVRGGRGPSNTSTAPTSCTAWSRT